jgi:hypothetical protein
MNDGLQSEMLEVTRLTRAGRLTEATALLQRALRVGTVPGTVSGRTGEAARAPAGGGARIIDRTPDTIELTAPQASPPAGQSPVPAPAAGRQAGRRERPRRTCPRRCAACSPGSTRSTPSREWAGWRSPFQRPRPTSCRTAHSSLRRLQQSSRQPRLQALRPQGLSWAAGPLGGHAARLHPVA